MQKLSLIISVIFLIFLSACSAIESTTDNDKIKKTPANTIKGASGKTFIALVTPLDGCQVYRQHSAPGRMVIQVIYYKHPDNKFSPIREGAICN